MGGDLRDLTKANKAAAEVVAVEARNIAPRVTGHLAGSTRATATKVQGQVAVGSSSVPYAGPIIFGWPRRNIAPNPFIYEALDDRRGEVEDVYHRRVDELIRRVYRETP